MGLIYMITSPSGKRYVGQHKTDDFDTRKKSHSRNYINFLKAKCIIELKNKFDPTLKIPANPKGFCTALYCAFQKYGFHSFTWDIVHPDLSESDLDMMEDYYILAYNTLHPYGYNLKLNSVKNGKSTYSDATRKQMSESHIKSVRENLHKYRKKHKELEDVPQFVTYFDSGGIRGYRINKHPKCPFKQFADADTPIETLKRQMLEFLQQCESEPYVTVQKRKSDRGIPKGISEQKPGRFIVQFAYKGKRYTKFFWNNDRAISLAAATEWMNAKKESLLQEESSETKCSLASDLEA
jgi:hypothetical protein